MKRDPRYSLKFWNEWVDFRAGELVRMRRILDASEGNRHHRPQYTLDLAKTTLELMLSKYSRGDDVSSLVPLFETLLEAWEESILLEKGVYSDAQIRTRNSWAVNIDFYDFCFRVVGLAILLEIPEIQWRRLITVVGNVGQDAVLDRVIASRDLDREIGRGVCFAGAYGGLVGIFDTACGEGAQQLRRYVDGWFQGLFDAGSRDFPLEHRTPYWWVFCADEERGVQGGYFGCWCIEAAVVAKIVGVDDEPCIEHPYYPGDLVRDGRSPRYPDIASEFENSGGAESSLRRIRDIFGLLFRK